MSGYKESSDTLLSADGLKLFYRKWLSDKPKGIVVIAHGLGEHSGRYNNLINFMAEQGISFYAMDHRGHGLSEGKRGHVNSFGEYINDLKNFINLVKEQNPMLPLILLGHSMGGVIALNYALEHKDLDGLILSSAGLIPAFELPKWQVGLARILSIILPKFTMKNGLDANQLSHDLDLVKNYLEDPLVHDTVSMRWFTEFTTAGENGIKRSRELTIPLLIFHGREDKIVSYTGSEKVYNMASSSNKQLIIFDSLYHETMNETPELRTEVLDKVSDWIMMTINQAQ